MELCSVTSDSELGNHRNEATDHTVSVIQSTVAGCGCGEHLHETIHFRMVLTQHNI